MNSGQNWRGTRLGQTVAGVPTAEQLDGHLGHHRRGRSADRHESAPVRSVAVRLIGLSLSALHRHAARARVILGMMQTHSRPDDRGELEQEHRNDMPHERQSMDADWPSQSRRRGWAPTTWHGLSLAAPSHRVAMIPPPSPAKAENSGECYAAQHESLPTSLLKASEASLIPSDSVR